MVGFLVRKERKRSDVEAVYILLLRMGFGYGCCKYSEHAICDLVARLRNEF